MFEKVVEINKKCLYYKITSEFGEVTNEKRNNRGIIIIRGTKKY